MSVEVGSIVNWLIAWPAESVCGLSFESTYGLTGAGTGFFTVRLVVAGLDMIVYADFGDYVGIIAQQMLSR